MVCAVLHKVKVMTGASRSVKVRVETKSSGGDDSKHQETHSDSVHG